MKERERQELLIRAAKLYYESDMSQDQIAKELQLSRPYVSKLLSAAKKEGYVQIKVIDPISVETSLEREFREYFHLQKVIIEPRSSEMDPLDRIGRATARFLNDIIRDDDIIVSSWGNTLYHVSKSLISREDLQNITYVQGCGGVSNVNSAVYASEIANYFSAAYNGRSYLWPLPAVVGSKILKEQLMQDDNIRKVLDLTRAARIAIFTIGSFGQKNALVREGYLSQEKMQELSDRGAVGDIYSHVIDYAGNLCDDELDQRTISLPLHTIREKEYRICVAQGISKIDSIIGALNSKLMNVFITNEETAALVLSRLKKAGTNDH